MGEDDGGGLVEDAGVEEEVEVVEMVGEGGGGHVEVALHVELATLEGGVRTLEGEGVEEGEGGVCGGEESGEEERVRGPVRGGREGGEEGGELGADELPAAEEGAGGERGKEEEGEQVVD